MILDLLLLCIIAAVLVRSYLRGAGRTITSALVLLLTISPAFLWYDELAHLIFSLAGKEEPLLFGISFLIIASAAFLLAKLLVRGAIVLAQASYRKYSRKKIALPAGQSVVTNITKLLTILAAVVTKVTIGSFQGIVFALLVLVPVTFVSHYAAPVRSVIGHSYTISFLLPVMEPFFPGGILPIGYVPGEQELHNPYLTIDNVGRELDTVLKQEKH